MGYRKKERAGFLLPHRCRLQLKYLSDAEQGQLLMALLDYSELGTRPAFTGMIAMAFDTIAEEIDYHAEIYANRCQTNKRNRAASSDSDTETSSTIVDDGACSSAFVDDGEQAKQSEAKQNKANTPSKPPEGTKGTQAFECFWDAYPRKQGKQAARKALNKALQKVPLDTMLAALEAQKQSHDWQKDDGQFVPYPSSWLNGCRWEDEPAQPVCQTTLQPEFLPTYEEGVP